MEETVGTFEFAGLTILAKLDLMGTDEWAARINLVIDSVRNDVAASHSLAELADRANSSTHNFHRRFCDVTGETPAQFVRRSRLERAAYLMMAAPDRTLTDICMDVGFSDQSDFSRSFRQLYGVAPSRWERRQESAGIQISAAPTVRIVTRPAAPLATLRVKGIFGLDAMNDGYMVLLNWMHDHGLDPNQSALVGMSFDNYRTTPRDRIHYSFGFTVPAGTKPSGPLHIRRLPAFTAASIAIDGGLPEIAEAWNHLYDHWFPASPWTPNRLPAMKLFRRRPDEIGWNEFALDCAVSFREGNYAEQRT